MQKRFFEQFVLAKISGDEMVALDTLEPERFLAPGELLRDSSMRLPIARRQFRAGRVALKTAFFAVKSVAPQLFGDAVGNTKRPMGADFYASHGSANWESAFGPRADETIALIDALERDDYATLGVCSRNERNCGVAPTLFDQTVDNSERPTGANIFASRGSANWVSAFGPRGSISHVSTAAVAIYPLNPGDALGCDLVEFGAVKRNMLDLFFTETERAWLNDPAVWESGEQDVVWGAKEAAYKAVSRARSFNPNQIEVVPGANGRYRVRAEGVELTAFVCDRDQFHATVVALREE